MAEHGHRVCFRRKYAQTRDSSVIALSLFTRFHSRVDSEGRGSFAERLLAALRNEFGGHAVVENRE
ncbi:MAG: hypothetical protein JOZ29_06800 [Deltaproteobacteria bacterium]|nr:hypothetical protein [Deltaproteobacteria bacterium]